MRKSVVKFAAVGAMAVGAAIMSVGSAAAGAFSIEGTCPNNGNWYTSSNVRYVTVGDGGTISASFSSFPDGMHFCIIDSNGVQHGIILASSSTRNLSAGDTWSGESFNNKYGDAGYDFSYHFSGTENY